MLHDAFDETDLGPNPFGSSDARQPVQSHGPVWATCASRSSSRLLKTVALVSVQDYGLTRLTAGGAQLPSRMEGGVSFGQYMRIVRLKWPFGTGSQLASWSFPGDSCWT